MLPKIEHPISTFIIPSTKKSVRVRPYVTKEEKILLIAKESGNSKEILEAVKQIINNCMIDSDVNVNKLTTFDIEYLYLKLYAISVSNMVHIEYTDYEDKEDEKGNKKLYKFNIDLLGIEVTYPEHVNNRIKINNDMGIVMKYLTMDIPESLYKKESKVEVLFSLINLCIDKVWKNDELFDFAEQSEQEKLEFVENLPNHTLEDISKFFKHMPKILYVIHYKNQQNNDRQIRLEKLDDFFSFR